MAEFYGYEPQQTDALFLRDLAVMLWGGVSRKRDAWRRTATTNTMIYNAGGMRGEDFKAKQPSELYPNLFDDIDPDEEWEKEVAAQFDAYNPDD